MWNRNSHRAALFLALAILLVLTLPRAAVAQGAEMFPTLGTSDKPQSKLWHNDGYWWACIDDLQKLSIYRLEGATWVQALDLQAAVVPILKGGTSDALWDGRNLFVAAYDPIASLVYKLGYDAAAKTYAVLPGFPVALPMRPGSETIVLDEDSTGRLWATYEAETKIYVTYTTSADHKTWLATPLAVGTGVNIDDISSVVAFGGNRIGVAWSDQTAQRLCFRVHRDADPPGTWQSLEVIRSSFGCIDDHINLKADSEGRVFMAAKYYFDAVYVCRRNLDGSWTVAAGASGLDCGTRPILQLDQASRRVYVFYTRWETCVSVGTHAIEERVADLDNLLFSMPTVVIRRPSVSLNDASGCKQVLPAGCMAVVCEGLGRAYWAGWGSVSGIGGSDPGGALPPPPPAPQNLAVDVVEEDSTGSVMLLRLDESSGRTAADASGNGRNASLASGLAAPHWVSGVVGNGLFFDGSNYMTVSSNSVFAFLGGKSFTLEAWIKADLTNSIGTGMIFSRGDSLHGNYFFSLTNQTLELRWSINDSTDVSVKGKGTLRDNAWHHVAGVYAALDSAPGQGRIYIDGRQVAAKTLPPPVYDEDWKLCIGALRAGGGIIDKTFAGSMDLVRVCDRAVYRGDFTPPVLYPVARRRYPRLRWSASSSPAGIRAYSILRVDNGRPAVDLGNPLGPTLWFADLAAPDGLLDYSVRAVDGLTQSGVAATASITYQGLVPMLPGPPLDLAATQFTATVDGPAFYELDEGSGSSSADGTGLEHSARLGDAPAGDGAEPAWVPGIEGKALQFDGQSDYVLIADRNDLRSTGSFTIEAWVRRTRLGAQQALVTKDAGSTKRNYGVLVLANGTIEFSWAKTSGSLRKTTSSAGITDQNWHHVACEYDATLGVNSIYLDGTLAGSGSASGTPYTGFEPILLGARSSGAGTGGATGVGPLADWLQGDLDLVRLSDRVLYRGPFTPPQLYRGGRRRHVLRLSWRLPATGLVAGYKLYRDLPGGSSKTLVALTSIQAPYAIDGAATPGTYVYTVTALDAAGAEGSASAPLQAIVSASTDAEQAPAPRGPALAIAPNPFNPQATVSFRVERSGPVELALYDARGRRLETLVNGVLAAGEHRRPLVQSSRRERLASGVYFVRLRADGRDTRLKVVLLQ